jgi:hypothetical protein
MNSRSIKSVLALTWIVLCFHRIELRGQDTQVWLDFYAYKSFARYGVDELNLGYDKLVKDQGWQDIYLCNTATYPITGWYELEGSAEFHKTIDPAASDIYEIRPFLAQKFIFNMYLKTIHLQNPYLYTRLEERFFWYTEPDSSYNKTRLRIRLGGRFIFGKSNVLENKTFYIPWYIEAFYNINGEAKEHRAEKGRAVAGFGYMFDEHWRLELVYLAQYGRNSLEGGADKTDNIFQLQVKYYIDAR